MMAALFAATYPTRVEALVLANATARPAWAEDAPWGVAPEVVDALVETVDERWGEGVTMAAVNLTVAVDEQAVGAWGRFLRLAASPAVAAAVIRMIFETRRQGGPSDHPRADAGRLPAGRPLRRLQRASGRGPDPASGVRRGAGRRLRPRDRRRRPRHRRDRGVRHGSRPAHGVDRVLATVLFTDIVESTRRAAELGDRGWRTLLDAHEEIARREVRAHGGRIADFAGDGVLATFDGPARAVRCALALREHVHAVGIQIRAGLHTGEIEQRGDGVAGIAVHIAARVMALAEGDEVLVSRTVKTSLRARASSSTIGAPTRLKGVPDVWHIFRAEP